MDLDQMSAFLEVVSTGKLSDAAAKLYISQSALSKQMSKLEEEVGVKLFVKTRNGVELTQAGWDFYSYARQAVHNYKLALNRLSNYSESGKDVLRFGSLPLSEEYGIEDALGQYWASHTRVQIEYIERSQRDLMRKLDTGQIDLALLRVDLLHDDQRWVLNPLLADELVAACTPDHPLASKRSVPIAALRNERFILLESKSDVTRLFVRKCMEAGFYPNTPLHTSRHRILLRAVQNGLGITVLPRRMVEAYLSADILAVPFEDPIFTTIGFAYPSSIKVTPLMEDFMGSLHEILHSMGSLSYNLLD
ncbi:LysR family transcriptional regulator [Olsenella sp. kh2p3]|uniref:LysR family transcriptional regulator n=1 Tax=Olsenella sp. kh2p3 TaxID=1797112 RepID=UPI00090F4F19|nr:LysR family transcriptional regulator [Olsenella sp. kh2p3]SFX53097.1 DNA-binding transcriptional regulator, LysR family [Olsenella sp. kh2p3]